MQIIIYSFIIRYDENLHYITGRAKVKHMHIGQVRLFQVARKIEY